MWRKWVLETCKWLLASWSVFEVMCCFAACCFVFRSPITSVLTASSVWTLVVQRLCWTVWCTSCVTIALAKFRWVVWSLQCGFFCAFGPTPMRVILKSLLAVSSANDPLLYLHCVGLLYFFLFFADSYFVKVTTISSFSCYCNQKRMQ